VLGVNRSTLWRVAEGQWNLPTLRAKYLRLLRARPRTQLSQYQADLVERNS
jgi:hypothetical protein